MDMTKYNHVIHPLKQLEEVWGIDLASTLQMYAAEVMEITVEMGGRALNFAQAALLIMGASSIYSKKVDSLQQLVSDTYDLILNRKKDETADSKKKRRTRVVLRQAVPFTEESAAIRAGSKLARTDVMDTMRLLLSGSDCLGFRNAARDQIRINEGELVPFENVVDGGYNYRVNICAVTGEGLLLPNVRQELVGASCQYQNEHTTPRRNAVHLPGTPCSTVTSRQILTNSAQKEQQMEDEKGFGKALAEEMKKAIEEDERRAREEEDAETEPEEEQRRNQEADEEEEEQPAEEDDYDVLLKGCMQDRFAVTLPDKAWEKMEIAEKSGAGGDPTKNLITDLLSEKLTSNRLGEVRKIDALGNVLWNCDEMERMAPARYADVEAAYAMQAKERLKKVLGTERKIKQTEIGLLSQSQQGDSNSLCASSAQGDFCDMETPVARMPEMERLPDVDVEMDEGHGEDLDSIQNEPCEPLFLEDGLPTQPDHFGDAAACDFPEHLDFNADIARMNELLHASHIQSTEKQANISRMEAALHQRIAAWQDKLAPMLADQNERPAFDIHRYAARILEQFSRKGDSYTFAKLASLCVGPWEISRYFLAMLQLTNTQNIQLDIKHTFDGTKSDEVKLTLLTRESAFNFDTFDETTLSPVQQRGKRGKKRKQQA
ncbi:Condensin-2 complex subunit H2 [Diplonema papillatum]|nr:Condensin-2 complex subunit H2 [Diplonema papillatum]